MVFAARLVRGDGVERDQERDVRDHVDLDEPLRERDGGEHDEDAHRMRGGAR